MLQVLILLLSIVLIIPALLVACYHLLLMAVSFFAKSDTSKRTTPISRFAIVIPAHNEEGSVGKTVESCRAADYPPGLFNVYVVADNCSDNTAGKAEAAGAMVLVRFDDVRKGKGFVLQWAFEQLAKESLDAYLILDADCVLDPRALGIFNDYLATGAEVIQSGYGVSNADSSAISYILTIGNQIESRLLYFPKSRLGLPVFLRGTGMVLTKSLLKRVPWSSYSIVEDFDYSIDLLRSGIRVVFLWDTLVWTEVPANVEQLKVQRTRWAGGNLGPGKKRGLRLVSEGLRKGNIALIDAGWSLLVLSRPLILAELLLAVAVCILAALLVPGLFSKFLLTIAFGTAALQFVYFLTPVFMLGLDRSRLLLLLRAPLVIGRLAVISMKGLLGTTPLLWHRTPRN